MSEYKVITIGNGGPVVRILVPLGAKVKMEFDDSNSELLLEVVE